MSNCSLSRQLFVNNVFSLSVNSAGTVTSMAKDYVEKNCSYQYSTGYIKAICARVMCFDVNTNFVNCPGFVHQALLRP